MRSLLKQPRLGSASALLREGDGLARRGHVRGALRAYRAAVALEPANAEAHAKLAPALARSGLTFDAWLSFETAGRIWLREDAGERVESLFEQATRLLPRLYQTWIALAEVRMRNGDSAGAIRGLCEGARRLRGRRLRPQAIHLLRHVRRYERWHPAAILELVALLARSGQSDEATMLVDGLTGHVGGTDLRRAWRLQWRLTGSWRSAGRWLALLCSREGWRVAAHASPARPERSVIDPWTPRWDEMRSADLGPALSSR